MASSADHPSSASERVHFLDWLRVIAIGILLFFHTAMLFMGEGWHIEDAQTVPALELPMDIAHRLRMPLLFIIAGASMHFALRRRGTAEVLRERVRRLLLPFAAGMVLVVPPMAYVEYLHYGEWLGGTYHLWFILYLFLYSLIFVPLFAWWQRRGTVWQPGFWVYLLALPLGVSEALLRPYFPESHDLLDDWWTIVHYALLFVYGFVLCRTPGMWDWLLRWRQLNLVLGIVVIATILVGEAQGVEFFQDDTVGDALSANVFTWMWILVFLGYGRRWLSFSNGKLRYLSEAGYPIYILHQTVIVVVAWFVIQQPWPWQVKYFVVLAATVVLSFAIYEGLIRRWHVPRLLFGLKP